MPVRRIDSDHPLILILLYLIPSKELDLEVVILSAKNYKAPFSGYRIMISVIQSFSRCPKYSKVITI